MMNRRHIWTSAAALIVTSLLMTACAQSKAPDRDPVMGTYPRNKDGYADISVEQLNQLLSVLFFDHEVYSYFQKAILQCHWQRKNEISDGIFKEYWQWKIDLTEEFYQFPWNFWQLGELLFCYLQHNHCYSQAVSLSLCHGDFSLQWN